MNGKKDRKSGSGGGSIGGFAGPHPTGGDGGGMGGDPPQPTDGEGRFSVLVEMRSPAGGGFSTAMNSMEALSQPGIRIDHEFAPVPMGQPDGQGMTSGTETVVVRATLEDEGQMRDLQSHPDVIAVWKDTPIAPFAEQRVLAADTNDIPAMAPCPIGTCDCAPGTPKGTIADVATYLQVNSVWAAGFRGAGIVVGVLDSGMTAIGRPVKAGETTRRIARVIGGWPADWGTETGQWSQHGNMCATDVLGMAPDAQLYDLRIAGAGGSPGTISRALQAFQWAIDRFRVDGTPQVLTNSWGIFQENWDPTYARNAAHPFTRKVVEAIDLGIIVLFAAGNCGDTCPDGRCGADNGPGRSIWGANGHPRVITVGAVNRLEQFIGYSSRGPAALDPNKPDFCSISHFTGYFTSDSGTSAATPIAAGVVALLRQAKPSIRQDAVKNALRATAKDIGPTGFDQHSGAGIINGRRAFDRVRGVIVTRPLIDAIVTRVVDDRIATGGGLDTAPTRDLLKLPIADIRGTIRVVDQIKAPVRDVRETIAEHIGLPPPHLRSTRGRQQPFALAMPHRAELDPMDEGGMEEERQGQIEQLADAIEVYQGQLEELIAAYQELVDVEDQG